MACYIKGSKESTERVPNNEKWNNLNNKMSNTILNNNLKYKISIHESILMQINDWIKKYIVEDRQVSHVKF